MKAKSWIFPALSAAIIIAGSLVIGVSSRASEKKVKQNSICCQKVKQVKDCQPSNSGGGVLDNLSSQFMIVFPR